MLLSNARWAALAQGCRIAAQLAGLAILARLLRPQDYGLMAMVSVVLALALMLRDMGTASALIQRATLDHATINAVFWLNLGIGLLLLFGLLAGAPALALLFRAPELERLLAVVSVIFPISASAAVHQALLERGSDFRRIALIEIASTVLALLLAIALALSGWGVLSLVAQTIAAATISALLLWSVAPWRPAWRVDWGRLREIAGFSAPLAGFNFINYFSRNADTVLISRVLGSSAAGVYSLAYKLMLFPLQNLTFVLGRAMYPVFCGLQHDLPRMRSLYLRVLRSLVMVTAPLMGGVAVLREPFIALVFGPQWQAAAGVLAWLAPTGLLQSIVSTIGTVLMARGRADLLFRLGLGAAVLQVGAFVIGVRYGTTAVAFGYFVANLAAALPSLAVLLRQLEATRTQLAGALGAALAATVLMCAALAGLLAWIGSAQAARLPVFCALCAGGAALYLLLMRYALRQDLSDLLKFGRVGS